MFMKDIFFISFAVMNYVGCLAQIHYLHVFCYFIFIEFILLCILYIYIITGLYVYIRVYDKYKCKRCKRWCPSFK